MHETWYTVWKLTLSTINGAGKWNPPGDVRDKKQGFSKFSNRKIIGIKSCCQKHWALLIIVDHWGGYYFWNNMARLSVQTHHRHIVGKCKNVFYLLFQIIVIIHPIMVLHHRNQVSMGNRNDLLSLVPQVYTVLFLVLTSICSYIGIIGVIINLLPHLCR